MKPIVETDTFKVWASDNMVYGPVQLPALLQWVQEGRVLADSWIFAQDENAWYRAREIEPLRGGFNAQTASGLSRTQSAVEAGVNVEELRAFSVFGGHSNQQLEQIISCAEHHAATPGELIIRKGDPGDALFFVLAGSVRARLVVGLEDTTLGQIPAGEFFGEVAMFSNAVRSADVVAEEPTRLMRISTEGFLRLIVEAPESAASLLFGLARMMANRFVERNLRLQREIASSFVWR